MSCSVKGCKNVKRFKPEGVTFHRFPRGDLLKEWLNVLSKDSDWKWSENKLICSRHFNELDFIRSGSRTYLRPNAVPSLNLQVAATTEVATTSKSGIQTQHKKAKGPTAALLEGTTSVELSQTLQSSSLSSSRTSVSDTSVPSLLHRKLKRHMGETSGRETSTDSSGTKRKKIKFIQTIHSYSTSPSKIKKKYIESRKVGQVSRKKLYSAKKTIKNLKKKITTLTTIVQDLKQKQHLSEVAINHLEKCYEDVPHLLMRRYIKNTQNKTTTKEKYPENLRNFACTLQFYSSKAYEYVRQTFALGLPHPSVIRKWCASINCFPGFSDTSFNALKIKVEEAKQSNREVICSLLLDEMSIKKQIDFDGKRTWGYVDVGISMNRDDLEIASEALVLMVVSHNSHWKLPIAYFFIKTLNGIEKANIVNEALIRLHDIGISVTSITCDGPSAHFAMLKELGCHLDDIHNMKTWFPHPAYSSIKVFCLLDVCHMLKLIRNLLATLGQIKTEDGVVDWNFIKKLYLLQEEETLTLANKLKKSHIEWERQKMKVNLAAQTLSCSVADALDFLNRELKHPNFQGVEATVSFIRRIDRLFDILNSKSPWAREFKAPLKESNEQFWRPFLMDTIRFLVDCTNVDGRPLYRTPRKTPIFGFVISSVSIIGIFDDFIKTHRLNYLLSYKCSQDHLEIFFCSVRSRNGWNNNPTSLQFMHTFRRLLLFSHVSQRGGNCKVLDDTSVLKVPSTTEKKPDMIDVDVSLCRRYNLDVSDEVTTDHDYDVLPFFIDINQFSLNVITYVSGYVVRMLKRSYKCPECITNCIASRDEIEQNQTYRFILKKDRGGLQVPAEGVVKICQVTEMFIRRILVFTGNRIPCEEYFVSTFVIAVAQNLYSDAEKLFPFLIDHNLCFASNEENHLYILIKKIIAAYTRIRFFNLAKKYTEIIQGPAVRKQLTKLILFNHQ